MCHQFVVYFVFWVANYKNVENHCFSAKCIYSKWSLLPIKTVLCCLSQSKPLRKEEKTNWKCLAETIHCCFQFILNLTRILFITFDLLRPLFLVGLRLDTLPNLLYGRPLVWLLYNIKIMNNTVWRPLPRPSIFTFIHSFLFWSLPTEDRRGEASICAPVLRNTSSVPKKSRVSVDRYLLKDLLHFRIYSVKHVLKIFLRTIIDILTHFSSKLDLLTEKRNSWKDKKICSQKLVRSGQLFYESFISGKVLH